MYDVYESSYVWPALRSALRLQLNGIATGQYIDRFESRFERLTV